MNSLTPSLTRPGGAEPTQSPTPADCFDDPNLPSISTYGHDFCTRWGEFTVYPRDPKTGISRFTSESTFMGRDPRGIIRAYPGGSTISVHPDGTVTVDSDI
jgi:hypothetical protein